MKATAMNLCVMICRVETIKKNMLTMPALIEEFYREKRAARVAKQPKAQAIPLVPEVRC